MEKSNLTCIKGSIPGFELQKEIEIPKKLNLDSGPMRKIDDEKITESFFERSQFQ